MLKMTGMALAGALLAGCGGASDEAPTARTAPAPVETMTIATDAYLFGYPLVIADVTRQVMTAVASEGDTMKAPPNQFVHVRAFPDHTFTDVVSPNADTLYSTAWLDVSGGPMILSVPAMGKRYYLVMLMDAWTNVFASPGTRTTGNGKGDFAIVGPGWSGQLPPNVKEIKSPTTMLWLVVRTQTNGASDYTAVHAVQDQYKLTPLSAWGKPYTPPTLGPVAGVDAKTPPVEQVARMNATTFFGRLNALMQGNPPAAADAPALARFAAIGVAPGKPFDPKALDPTVAAVVESSAKAGQARLVEEAKKPHGTNINGWDVTPANTADFGTDYTWRAVVAMIGLGANVQADAVYPHATVDSTGQPLSGANRYTIRFAKGQQPPVKAFWSVTMYNAKQAFVQNPLGRYAIGDRDKLKTAADGSVTLYVQHDSPGKALESNWLPAPPDSFNVFMRLYWPSDAILDGTWKMPPVERVP